VVRARPGGTRDWSRSAGTAVGSHGGVCELYSLPDRLPAVLALHDVEVRPQSPHLVQASIQQRANPTSPHNPSREPMAPHAGVAQGHAWFAGGLQLDSSFQSWLQVPNLDRVLVSRRSRRWVTGDSGTCREQTTDPRSPEWHAILLPVVSNQ
jgi:hypothetical protein